MNRPEVQNKGTGKGKEHNGVSHKGISRLIRIARREEAEDRNRRTHPYNRRAHWKAQGFLSKSHAATVVGNTVRETNSSAQELRRQIGLMPLQDELLNAAR